jgi:biopolymer transport protein ExbB
MNPITVFLSGGPIMWPLLIIAICAVCFTVNRFMAYGQSGSSAPGLLPEVLDMVKSGREGDALRRAEEMTGPVAGTIATVLRNRNQPIDDVEREVEANGEEYFVTLERFLPALDTFTTLSPLLGLLGTILGMVKVFQQFSSANSDEGKAKILSGVGESLYATAFGITIAVFCFAVYNYFSARQRSLRLETEQAANKVIAQMHEKSIATRR